MVLKFLWNFYRIFLIFPDFFKKTQFLLLFRAFPFL